MCIEKNEILQGVQEDTKQLISCTVGRSPLPCSNNKLRKPLTYNLHIVTWVWGGRDHVNHQVEVVLPPPVEHKEFESPQLPVEGHQRNKWRIGCPTTWQLVFGPWLLHRRIWAKQQQQARALGMQADFSEGRGDASGYCRICGDTKYY